MVQGRELYNLLVELTGLERKVIESELEVLMARLKLDPDKLTTEDLRQIVAAYLEEVRLHISTLPLTSPTMYLTEVAEA